MRPVFVWIAGKQTRWTFNHYSTYVGVCWCNQMDWRWQLLACPFAHGFRAYASFSPAATSQCKPVNPVTIWLNLIRPGDEPPPIVEDGVRFSVAKRLEKRRPLGFG